MLRSSDRFEVGLFVTVTVMFIAVVTYNFLTMSVPPNTVYLPGGDVVLGLLSQDIEADYQLCREMISASEQDLSVCEPKDSVFGDRPARVVPIPAFRIDIYERNFEGVPFEANLQTALEICKENGGRLPTEDEWEYAARGLQGRYWPWGNTAPTESLANIDVKGGFPNRAVAEVGSYPAGATPEGVYDLVGNMWEWVSMSKGGYTRKGGGAGTIAPFTNPAGVSPGEFAGFRCVYAP